MLNHVTIQGRLTHDVELRRTSSGTAVASFSVACERDYAPQGQEKETDFINCTAFGKSGEFVSKYFQKGSMIIVEGRLQIRRYTDKEGKNRTAAEVNVSGVNFCGFQKDGAQANQKPYSQSTAQTNSYSQKSNQYDFTPGKPVNATDDFTVLDNDDDMLPF